MAHGVRTSRLEVGIRHSNLSEVGIYLAGELDGHVRRQVSTICKHQPAVVVWMIFRCAILSIHDDERWIENV